MWHHNSRIYRFSFQPNTPAADFTFSQRGGTHQWNLTAVVFGWDENCQLVQALVSWWDTSKDHWTTSNSSHLLFLLLWIKLFPPVTMIDSWSRALTCFLTTAAVVLLSSPTTATQLLNGKDIIFGQQTCYLQAVSQMWLYSLCAPENILLLLSRSVLSCNVTGRFLAFKVLI